MMGMDDRLRIGKVGEGVLHYLGETLAALRLIRDFKVDICRPEILFSLRLLELAPGQVELDVGSLLLLLVLSKGLLEDLEEIFIRDFVIIDVLRDLHEVDLLEVLIE